MKAKMSWWGKGFSPSPAQASCSSAHAVSPTLPPHAAEQSLATSSLSLPKPILRLLLSVPKAIPSPSWISHNPSASLCWLFIEFDHVIDILPLLEAQNQIQYPDEMEKQQSVARHRVCSATFFLAVHIPWMAAIPALTCVDWHHLVSPAKLIHVSVLCHLLWVTGRDYRF